MRKLLREVTYLVGNSAEKRRMLRTGGKCVARACPDEVSAVCRMGGKDYYVVGRHPFARFSVWEYMRYERALLSPSPLTKKQAREMLKGAGLRVRLSARLGSLDGVARRIITAISRITLSTTTVALVLDGLPYSVMGARKLHRAVEKLRLQYCVWVAVTDSRFIKGRQIAVCPNSIYARPKRYYSRVVRRLSLVDGLKARFIEPPVIEKGKVVCVSER